VTLPKSPIYRFRGGDVVAPLDDRVAELLFGGMSPADWLAHAAFEVGYSLGVRDVDDRDAALPADAIAVIRDDVIVNGAALMSVIDAAGTGVARAALRTQTALGQASARLTDAGDFLDVPLWAGAVAGRTLAELEHDHSVTRAVIGDAGAVSVDVRPYGRAPHALAIADVERLLLWPRHWLHVLDGGLAALRERLRSERPRHAKRTRPKVHPTARVIGSVLGDGVVVEAHASVIDSVIGDDVIVADHSVVHTSAIGAGCRTLVDTHLRRVIAMGGSTLSNLDMQDAVFGRDVFLTTGVAFFQEGLGTDVVVDGRDSGRAVLGGAIGRGAVLGSRALMVAGTAIPAGALVVARPGEAVGKLDDKALAKANIRLASRADV